MTERDDATKLAIDTDDDELLEDAERAHPGEPVPIDVAFRAVTLERIALERDRDRGETIVAWIRDAIDRWLATVGGGSPSGDELRPGRADDDTPDSELIGAVLADPDDEWISVTLELPAEVLERAAAVADQDGRRDTQTSTAEWIRRAVDLRFARIDREVELRPRVEVDVPPAIVERARLRARYAVIRDPGREYHEALRDALLDLVQPQTEYLVDGVPLEDDEP